MLIVWVILRIGTTLLVPMVEEMFFRGYVLARIGQGSPALRLLGIGCAGGSGGNRMARRG